MERPQIKGLSLTNWILVFIIIFSQVMYTVETEQELETGELNIYWFLDLLISGIFGIEFFSRIWVAGIDRRFRGLSGLFNYFKTNWFMLVVDFLAFAPELIFVIIGVNPPSWLRSLRVFRLIKMVRYIPAVELVTKALRGCIQELLVALSLSIILWYLASVVLYLAESAVQPRSLRQYNPRNVVERSDVDDRRLWRCLSNNGLWQGGSRNNRGHRRRNSRFA